MQRDSMELHYYIVQFLRWKHKPTIDQFTSLNNAVNSKLWKFTCLNWQYCAIILFEFHIHVYMISMSLSILQLSKVPCRLTYSMCIYEISISNYPPCRSQQDSRCWCPPWCLLPSLWNDSRVLPRLLWGYRARVEGTNSPHSPLTHACAHTQYTIHTQQVTTSHHLLIYNCIRNHDTKIEWESVFDMLLFTNLIRYVGYYSLVYLSVGVSYFQHL